MSFFRIASVVMLVALAACSESTSDNQPAPSEENSGTTPVTSTASCDSIDISNFCVSIDGAEKTLYIHTEDTNSPLLANPFITSRFDTSGGITLAEVRFDITPTSFIKAVSVIFSGNTAGTYIMDGSGNFSVYTLAADQSWTFISGFSSGTIEITQYGAVGEFIQGTYAATLCDSSNAILNGSDCSNSIYLINIAGNFNIKRDADI